MLGDVQIESIKRQQAAYISEIETLKENLRDADIRLGEKDERIKSLTAALTAAHDRGRELSRPQEENIAVTSEVGFLRETILLLIHTKMK